MASPQTPTPAETSVAQDATSGMRSVPTLASLKERSRLLWRSLNPLLGGWLVLSMGTVLGGGVVMLSSPIITRLYGPSTFGILAVYMSILAFATPFASCRYEVPIPIERNDAIAANLLAVSLILAFFTATVVTAAILWRPDWITHLTGEPDLRRYLPLLPIAFCFTAVYQVLSPWAVRSQAFPQIARTRASQSISSVATQLLVGAVNGSAWGLFAGDLVGRVSGTGVLLRHLRRTWPKGSLSLSLATAAMRTYVRFPMITTWASIVTLASAQLPVLMLSRFFGLEAAGWYALTSRVLATPSSLLGQGLGQALLGRAAYLQNNKYELRALTESTAAWTFFFGLPVFAFVGLEGPTLFTTAFGARWTLAGVYAQRLAPFFCLWLVGSPLNHLLTVRQWQAVPLVASSLQCLVTISTLYIGIRLKSAEAGITALGIGLFLLSVATLELAFRAGYTGWSRIVRHVIPMAVCAALSVAPVYVLLRGTALWALVTRFLLSCVVYIILISVLRLYPSRSWSEAVE